MRPKTKKIIKNAQCSFPALVSGLEIPEKEVRKTQKTRSYTFGVRAKNRLCHWFLRPRTFGQKPCFSHRHHSAGAKIFLHFSCFQKRRFSCFALVYGPKMPAERDSGRPEFPNSIRAEGPFWSPETTRARWDLTFRKNESARPAAISGELCVCVWRYRDRRPRGLW